MQRVLTTALVALSVCAGASACAGKTEPEFRMADQQAIRQAKCCARVIVQREGC